jgi:hypothetical protein
MKTARSISVQKIDCSVNKYRNVGHWVKEQTKRDSPKLEKT